MTGRSSTTDDLWTRAKANGYQRGAHTEIDKVRGGEKYVSKTKQDHDRTLRRYIQWRLGTAREDHKQRGLPPPDEEATRSQYLGKGVAPPDLVTVKDFLRFYIATSHPRIDKKVPTADAICTVGEWFFAGFTRVTGAEIKAEDRSEVYYWVRRTLTLEGVVANKHRPKHNFTVRDLTRVLLALWTYDDLIFIHERYRVQVTFLIHVYCWTGARINAFFTDGLRYKDIELILQRDHDSGDSRGWRLVYKIDQRWVKNNRDPENVRFGAAAKEHKRLFYNDAGFLLAMALADGALFGYDDLAAVRHQAMPAGKDELILRFKRSALDRPILRKCTKAGGVTDEPMTKAAFLDILRSTLVNAGYLCGASIHTIRRQLGKGIDKRNTAVERSQHLTQADPRVFGQSYVANCSSVDGQAAFRDEESDQRHIEYFQSLEKFHEDGLPDKLPAHLEEELKQDPRVCVLEAEMRALMGGQGDNQAFSTAKRQLTTYTKKLKRDALRLYQETWIQERRDWKILTRGREVAQDNSKTELAQGIYKLFPERGRLAQKMALTRSLKSDEMWDSLQDLHILCLQDSTVLYLPGSRPLDGACPVKCCRRQMDDLPKSQRNQHIQDCVRRETATREARLLSDIHYCYHCFDWVVGDGWEAHCQLHLNGLAVKRCGSVIHCHTLIRPAYCPFCIGNVSLPPSGRLKTWSRDHKLWVHVNDEHLDGCRWPLECHYPLCDSNHENCSDLRFHLMDVHKFSRSRPPRGTNPHQSTSSDDKVPPSGGAGWAGSCRKRKSPSIPEAVEWQPPQSPDSVARAAVEGRSDRPHKRHQPSPIPPTICPSVIQIDDDSTSDDDERAQTDAASPVSPPQGYHADNDGGLSSDLYCSPPLAGRPTPCEIPYSLERADSDDGADLDGSELDAMFKQYLRSPSSSPPPPSPDDTGSDLSGETLIDAGHDPFRNSSHLDVEPLAESASEVMPAGHVDRDLANLVPRIRLRVSQPMITLRLKLPSARQPRKGRKTGKRAVGNKSGRRSRGGGGGGWGGDKGRQD